MRPRPAWNETNTKSLQVPLSQTKKVQSYKVIAISRHILWHMNNNSHWKILSVCPLLQICAFLRPSDTKRISTCRCQQRSETSQKIKRSQTSRSLWLKFHPRFCRCWSRTRIHSSEFPSMTHVGFAPVALSFLSQTCAFCANGNFQKKNRKQEAWIFAIWKYDNIS